MEFRLLKADEIDVRVAQVKESGCSLLLYKDCLLYTSRCV